MTEINEKDEKFGEKVELPEGYPQFWKEYTLCFEGKNFAAADRIYLERRISLLFSSSSIMVDGDKDRIMLFTGRMKSMPVIHDKYTYHYKRDDVYGESTIPASAEKETIISIQPTIETVLYADEIRRYRKISPKLEEIKYFTWLNGNSAGNPHKVEVLLDLFDDYYASQEKQWREHQIQGNELFSIPSAYPIEKEIAQLYEKIGRNKFDALTEEYFDFGMALSNARKIDPNAVAGLEKSVQEQYREMRKEILLKL